MSQHGMEKTNGSILECKFVESEVTQQATGLTSTTTTTTTTKQPRHHRQNQPHHHQTTSPTTAQINITAIKPHHTTKINLTTTTDGIRKYLEETVGVSKLSRRRLPDRTFRDFLLWIT